MRIIGLDPGLRHLGWGVIEKRDSKLIHIANGVCKSSGDDLAIRLNSLFMQLTEVFSEFSPNEAAVEQVFVNRDGASTLKLGQARAVCLLVPAQAQTAVHEYAPNTIKKTIVGFGHAEKSQVQQMLKLQLGQIEFANADAADAVAIALCHAHLGAAQKRLAAQLGAA